jgi:hypothetical protein
LQDRTPGLDRTTDLFMDVLKRNGVKPEWIERQNRIAEMTSLVKRRIRTEYARALLDANPGWRSSDSGAASRAKDSTPKQPSFETFRAQVTSLASLQDDLAFLNREIDTYNLQVSTLQCLIYRLTDAHNCDTGGVFLSGRRAPYYSPCHEVSGHHKQEALRTE